MNNEHGISNYEVFLFFDIHYSLFIIRYSLLWLFVPLSLCAFVPLCLCVIISLIYKNLFTENVKTYL